MIPNAAEIVRARWVVAIVLRVAGVLVCLWCLAEAIDLADNLLDGTRADWSFSAWRLVVLPVGLAAAVFLMARPLIAACWLVPVPRSLRCPGCGHSTSGLRSPVCPECGMSLTAEFVDGAVGNSAMRGPELQGIIRMAGVVGFLFGIVRTFETLNNLVIFVPVYRAFFSIDRRTAIVLLTIPTVLFIAAGGLIAKRWWPPAAVVLSVLSLAMMLALAIFEYEITPNDLSRRAIDGAWILVGATMIGYPERFLKSGGEPSPPPHQQPDR